MLHWMEYRCARKASPSSLQGFPTAEQTRLAHSHPSDRLSGSLHGTSAPCL